MSEDTSSKAYDKAAIRARLASFHDWGYLHHSGHFVPVAEASELPEREAIRRALDLQKVPDIVPGTIEFVAFDNGLINPDHRLSLRDYLAEQELKPLVEKLMALEPGDVAGKLRVLDEEAIQALRALRIRLNGVQISDPPRHETGSLNP